MTRPEAAIDSGVHSPGAVALPLQVVLVEPEIPNNTGSVGRTCVAVGAGLHLVHPLAFDIDEKACRRAGLDYWPRLRLTEHASWEAYAEARSRARARAWTLSARATHSVFDAAFEPGDHLVFGCESKGLAPHQLEPERSIALPMAAGERSLNLANAVTAVVYEVVRQFAARGLVGVEAGRLWSPTEGG